MAAGSSRPLATESSFCGNADTGAIVERIVAHAASIGAVQFSPSGEQIASSSWDGTIHLWRPSDGSSRRLQARGSGAVPAIAFSPDGASLASASHDGVIRLWDVESGAMRFELDGHDYQAYAVAFHPSGSVLASGSRDQDLKLWNLETRSLIATRRGHGEFTSDLAFSPDGTRLVSASRSGELARVRDATTGEVIASLVGHSLAVRSVDFSLDGRVLATGSTDGTIRLWDTVSIAASARERSQRAGKLDRARQLVDELRENHPDWEAIASELRADPGLTFEDRSAALDEVLRRAAGE